MTARTLRHRKRQATALRVKIANQQRQLAHIERIIHDNEEISKSIDNPGVYIIEADAGTTCNNPAQGYGRGYGSYLIMYKGVKIKDVRRLDLGNEWSSNAAEVAIIRHALEYLSQLIPDGNDPVLVRGDSRIALNWVCHRGERKPSPTSYSRFVEEVGYLREVVGKFCNIGAEWRPREVSVKLFGH